MSIPVVHEPSSTSEASKYIPPDRKVWIIRVIGLLGGLALALLIYFIFPDNAAFVAEEAAREAAGNDPAALAKIDEMNFAGIAIVAAVAILMGVWWMTEAIPLAATALIPMIVFPALSVDTFKGAAGSYAADTIYLFMGGFIIALAMQRWNLHRRIALSVVNVVGTRPRQLVAGFMIATGFLSMWVSNTATAVMMLPIGLSVLQLMSTLTGENIDKQEMKEDIGEIPDVARDATKGGVVGAIVQKGKDTVEAVKERAGLHHSNFAVSLMLGIAYAASIGSLGTIIGTPPNTLLVAYLADTHDIHVGFGQWMLVGVPLAVVFLALGWFLLTFVLFKPEIDEIPGGKELIRNELKKLGRPSRGETWVAILFVLAALLWVFLPFALDLMGVDKPKGLDTIIAMGIALLMFIIPADAKRGVRLMNWETAKDLPWDILLLFGGGLALSNQFSHTGLSNWIGVQVEGLRSLPVILILIIVTLMVLGLTELTSNTATAAAFLPIMGGVAAGLGFGTGNNVMLFVIPVALAATCAFMLPVATPPNAIAYGSGYVRMSDMLKAGIWLNVIGVVLITITTLALAVPVFGLSLTPVG